MIETPSSLPRGVAPADDLSRYRWHTGAPLRPLAPDEPCPILFRDLGPVALRRFLRGELRRLAGPLTPITYLRTADFVEPYVDHARIGRLIFLRPALLAPWHAGVPRVFVARATRYPDPATIGYVPGDRDLAEAGARAASMRSALELREELGGARYDAAVEGALLALDALEIELAATERAAAPLRRALQSPRRDDRLRAREEMARLGITEDDLCAAWHHLPRARRDLVRDALDRARPIAAAAGGAA
jgi:hypothetical protein